MLFVTVPTTKRITELRCQCILQVNDSTLKIVPKIFLRKYVEMIQSYRVGTTE